MNKLFIIIIVFALTITISCRESTESASHINPIMIVREFKISPHKIFSEVPTGKEFVSVETELKDLGVTFCERSNAVYLFKDSKLVVRNSQENLDIIEKLAKIKSNKAVQSTP